MTKIALLLALLYMHAIAHAQQDTLSGKSMEEAIVYSNKFIEKKKNLAQKIDIITAAVISKYNSQNTGDLLINTGNIFVQKSQQGGSSPVIRGFEASRILPVSYTHLGVHKFGQPVQFILTWSTNIMSVSKASMMSPSISRM